MVEKYKRFHTEMTSTIGRNTRICGNIEKIIGAGAILYGACEFLISSHPQTQESSKVLMGLGAANVFIGYGLCYLGRAQRWYSTYCNKQIKTKHHRATSFQKN